MAIAARPAANRLHRPEDMMIRRSLAIAALAVLSAAATVSPASAGSPCCCVAPCEVAVPPPVVVYEPYVMPRIYVVDQGPVYSGPGIYTNRTVIVPRKLGRYPYVSRDYPYVGHRLHSRY
jgi:hypothetical protein